MSLTLSLVRSFMRSHAPEPKREMVGSLPSRPLYLDMRCRLCMLTKMVSPSR